VGINTPVGTSTPVGINTPVGTIALQSRIAAESRSYSRNFCNGRVHPVIRQMFGIRLCMLLVLIPGSFWTGPALSTDGTYRVLHFFRSSLPITVDW
jgi:hypothetical protein